MARSAGQKIAAATVLLMALECVDQGTGLLKQMVIAATFGTSASLDAYLVATTVSGLVLLWVTLPINLVVIPMFRHDLAREGERVAWANASLLFNNVAVILVLISGVVVLISPHVVPLFAPGFDPQTEALAARLSQIVVASVFFMGAGRVLSQILFSYERFWQPGVAGTVNNLVFIAAFYLIMHAWGVYGLAIAVVLGSVAELAVQLPILWEKRRWYSPRVDLRDPQMREMARLSVPLLLTAGGTEMARMTDRMFASLLPSGSLASLSFAQRLNSLQNDFVVRPLQRSSDPHFAKLGAERDFPALSRQLFHYVRIVFFVTLPLTIGLMAMSDTVVRLLFHRGAFDETSVRLTSTALMVYTLGFPATALSRCLDRTFFSLKDTRTPMKMALTRIGVKIVLAFILIRPFAHLGIALAEALSHCVRLPLLFLALPAEIRGQETRRTLGSVGRTMVAGAAMGATMWIMDARISGTIPLALEAVLVMALGLVVFGAVAAVLLRDEAQALLGIAAALMPRSLQLRRRESA